MADPLESGGDRRSVARATPPAHHRRTHDAIELSGMAAALAAWPRKGAIVVGADADLVLIDPAGRTDLGTGHMASDYSSYEGLSSAGRIERVYRRGQLVVAEGEMHAARGSGVWLSLTSVGQPAGRMF
jgi:cytosine/adenosine deaminase-related metal-dependent hydrolase